LDGKRIRKNFQTRAEAEAQSQVLEIQRLQKDTGIRATATRLTEDQLHEAELVFRRLAGRSNSLSFYVEFALATDNRDVRQVSRSWPRHQSEPMIRMPILTGIRKWALCNHILFQGQLQSADFAWRSTGNLAESLRCLRRRPPVQ
jgi:hypothetical protein